MSGNFAHRGEHRRAFRDNRERRHHKFRRYNKRHRHGHAYGHGYRQGYGYGPPRHRRGFWPGPAYAFQLDGARIILRFD